MSPCMNPFSPYKTHMPISPNLIITRLSSNKSRMKYSSCILQAFAFIALVSVISCNAAQDPELKQCKHQCRHQRQFDERQQEHCERQCEEYIRQKHQGPRRRGEEEGREVNPREVDPEAECRSCKERCQHGEHCERQCEEYIRQKHQGPRRRGKEGREVNPREVDPEAECRRCKERCQHGEEGRREQQVCESSCERRRREQVQEQEERHHRRGRDNLEEEYEEEEEEERETGEGRSPYVFEEGHFRTIERSQHGRMRVLPKFTERSKKLFKGIENYRVEIFEAAPHTFMVPKHCDADYIFFVACGRGKINLVHSNRRESFNIEHGHIMKIPAGVTTYFINNDDHRRLVMVKLIIPVVTPGHFQSFFGAGGENPESFFRAFSGEILEAALKVSRDQVERVFERQRDGMIIKASREQIRDLSQDKQEGGLGGSIWPFSGRGESERHEGPFNLLRQRPTHSNQHGKLMEVKPEECRSLEKLNMAISFANITRGSMTAPYFNSRATKISVVVNGRGCFEMACPHLAESRHGGRGQREREMEQEGNNPVHYEKVSGELRRGTVVIVPAGHPFVEVASQDDNLEVICFELNAEENELVALAGKNNVFRHLEREASELAFRARPEEVRRVFESQREDFFLPGPRHRQRGRRADA